MTMIKKKYMKPAMSVFESEMKQQILAGSVKSLNISGLDEDLILPGGDDPITGDIWKDPW